MSNISSNAVTKFKASIRYTNAEIEINVPTETRGIRRLVLDRHAIMGANLTDDEALIVQQLLDSGLPNRGWTEELTVSELKLLGSVGTKIGAPMGTVPSKVESSPGVNEKPVTPANEVKPLVQVVQGEETMKLTEKTVNFTAHGIAHHIGMRDKTPYESDIGLQQVQGMASVAKALKGKIWTVNYDIPKALVNVCPNPSYMLWRYGFRLTESVWVFTDETLNAPEVQRMFARWREHKIKFHIIRYHDDELANVRAIAQAQVEGRMRALHTSLIERIASADATLKEVQEKADTTPKELETANRARMNNVRGLIREIGSDLNDAIRSAEIFDNTEDLKDLIAAVRGAIVAEARAFNALATMKRLKTVDVEV